MAGRGTFIDGGRTEDHGIDPKIDGVDAFERGAQPLDEVPLHALCRSDREPCARHDPTLGGKVDATLRTIFQPASPSRSDLWPKDRLHVMYPVDVIPIAAAAIDDHPSLVRRNRPRPAPAEPAEQRLGQKV